MLHLHRLHDQERRTALNPGADLDHNCNYLARHWGGKPTGDRFILISGRTGVMPGKKMTFPLIQHRQDVAAPDNSRLHPHTAEISQNFATLMPLSPDEKAPARQV